MHNGEKSEKCNLCASSRSWHLKNTLEKIPSSFSHSYFVVTILNGHLHIWPEILLSPDIVSLKDLLFMADVDIVNNQPCWPLLILRPINYKPNKPRLDTHRAGSGMHGEINFKPNKPRVDTHWAGRGMHGKINFKPNKPGLDTHWEGRGMHGEINFKPNKPRLDTHWAGKGMHGEINFKPINF